MHMQSEFMQIKIYRPKMLGKLFALDLYLPRRPSSLKLQPVKKRTCCPFVVPN